MKDIFEVLAFIIFVLFLFMACSDEGLCFKKIEDGKTTRQCWGIQ